MVLHPVKYALSLLLLCMLCGTLPAARAAVLFSEPEYLLEESGPLSLSQVLQWQEWQPAPRTLNMGYTSQGLWLRQQIEMPVAEAWYLTIGYPLLDDVQLFWLQDKQILQRYHTGDGQVFNTRPVLSNLFIFRFAEMQPGPRWLYLRVQTSGTLSVPFYWQDERDFQQSSRTNAMIFGAFYGILLVMALYNLFIFFAIREPAYFYYVLTVSSILILQSVYDGNGFGWFWPDNPAVNEWAFPVIYCINQLMMLTFIANFLQVKITSAWFSRSFLLLRLTVVLLLLSSFWVAYHKIMPLVLLMGMVGILTGLSAGILLWRRGYKAARYFTLAWLLFCFGIVVATLKGLGILPDSALTNYGYMLGLVCETLFLSFALADRIESERLAKQQAEASMLEAKAENIKNLQRYQELYENAAVGNFQGDMDYRLTSVNSTFAKILGYDSARQFMQEVKDGRDVLITPVPVFQKILAEMQNKNILYDRELLLRNRHGEPRWVSITLRQAEYKGNQIIEGSMIDITQRKNAERINQHLERERLEGLEQLSLGVAREINTPLGSNVVTTAFLEDSLTELMHHYDGDKDDPEVNKFARLLQQSLQLINQNQKKVTRIVRRFREVSVSELGATQQVFNLHDTLQEFIANERWDMAGWRIHCDCPENLSLNSYPSALLRILSQLMENSRLHGQREQQAEALVGIKVVESDSGFISIHYYDNGPGIVDVMIPKLGQPFLTTLRGPNGRIGLGLFMVKNLVTRLLKGRVVYPTHMHSGFAVSLEIPLDINH